MLDKTTRTNLRGLQQDPRWESLNFAFNDYLKNYFLETSIKRENEFETLWSASFNEGGKFHLNNFFQKLEEEASKQ